MEKPTPCHSVLLMQTTIEYIRLSENTIRGCEQNVTCLTSHDRYQSWDSCHTVVSDYKVTFSPALHCLQSMMRFNHALYLLLTSAKIRRPLSPDALVNTSVFCTDLRFEFGGKTKKGLSAAS